MERAATFNSSFDSRNQLGDMWKVPKIILELKNLLAFALGKISYYNENKVMLSATDNARQLDQRYNLTSSLTAVGKSLYSGVLGG